MVITIPTDKDGYILLQCSYCGVKFKVTADDIDNDEILHIFCPSCGLISKNYITEDVLNLAIAMEQNLINDKIYSELKILERKTRNGTLKVRAEKKPEHEPEPPVHSGVEPLEITNFPCCNRMAKIKPLLRMTGCYCPFCGVKNDEHEIK